jgi:hypothetical protein
MQQQQQQQQPPASSAYATMQQQQPPAAPAYAPMQQQQQQPPVSSAYVPPFRRNNTTLQVHASPMPLAPPVTSLPAPANPAQHLDAPWMAQQQTQQQVHRAPAPVPAAGCMPAPAANINAAPAAGYNFSVPLQQQQQPRVPHPLGLPPCQTSLHPGSTPLLCQPLLAHPALQQAPPQGP